MIPRLRLGHWCHQIRQGNQIKQSRKCSIRWYSKTRNIGIIAHIDAGKTTTTERMLFYAGLTKRIGDIDQGDTVTDYLPAERERGITITSAAVTFPWNDHQINLIDTPGHADFTFEVIRSIRVLDGAVTVLDAVAGVEAQTEKVWAQANEMAIPKLVFVNKMDRAGAGFGRTVREVVAKLNTRVAIVNVPCFDRDAFVGVVDVVEKKRIDWTAGSDGKHVVVSELEGALLEECERARAALVEALCEFDDSLVEEFLELGDYMAIPSRSIKRALRAATIRRQLVPVLCGASFKNIGVQPLLDAIVDYLPSSTDRPPPRAVTTNSKNVAKSKAVTKAGQEVDLTQSKIVCALAFKVMHDPIRGMLVFVRVYSGRLQQNSVVLNTRTGQRERLTKLMQMQADKHVDLSVIETGEIGVIVGSKNVHTGDTLVAHATKRDGVSLLSPNDKHLHLNPISVPPPVFFASIEPLSLADQRQMDQALDILLKEDPSLKVVQDHDTSQTLLTGMGELHLEIAKDRLVNQLKARVEVGPVMVSFKETLTAPSEPITVEVDVEGAVSSATVVVEPVGPGSDNASPIGPDSDNNWVSYPESLHHLQISNAEMAEAIRIGAVPTFARGGKISHLPLYGVRVRVLAVHIPEDVHTTTAVSKAVRLAAEQGLDSLSQPAYAVVEPIMAVRLVVHQEDIGAVANDLSGNRRGHIESLGQDDTDQAADEDFKALASEIYTPPDPTLYLSKHEARTTSQQSVIVAKVPLVRMIGYLTALRSITQGRGTFLMDFESYEVVPADRVAEVVN